MPGLLMVLAFPVFSQYQLVILKGDRVISRIHSGTTFDVRRKGSTETLHGFLVEADEFTFITSRDTIAIRQVDAISAGKRRTFWSVLGTAMMDMGIGYLLIDQVNRYIVHGGRTEQDPSVWKTAGVLVGAGFPLSKARRKWDRPGRGAVRLLSVDYRSRFYRPKE